MVGVGGSSPLGRTNKYQSPCNRKTTGAFLWWLDSVGDNHPAACYIRIKAQILLPDGSRR